MPAEIKIAQQAKVVCDGRWKCWGRSARAICSLFVLLALAGITNHINSADVKIRFSLHAEAAFTTVHDHEPCDVPDNRHTRRINDQADGFWAICQSLNL